MSIDNVKVHYKETISKVIKPGATIGLLGGGQLGRMIALAGRNMGYRFVTLDPTANSPCGQVSDKQIVASFNDVGAARELANLSDVVTYEFENVDAQVTEVLEQQSYVPQGSHLLRVSQNRISEKTTIQSFGIPVAPFRAIQSVEDLQLAVQELGLPAVMKTATGGYDGKGQWVIRSLEELSESYDSLSRSGSALIVEQFIPFQMELSVIAARSGHGEVMTFPVAENIHVNSILHQSIVPARTSEKIQEDAREIARMLAEKLEVVGLLAVEMFMTSDGELYVNEIAPRPHNSGHFTMEACVTSQFEQHVRAICNLPLGSTKLLTPVVMVNILGEHMEKVIDGVERFSDSVKLHLYGKKDIVPKRKMGHMNVLADSVEDAIAVIDQLEIYK